VPNDKPQRARRRARNSQAPDLFQRAVETDNTLRKSTAGEAPSSRRGAAAIGTPSSRRGSQAAKIPTAGPAAGRPAEEALELDATPPASEQKAKSERRPKAGLDSAAEGAAGRAAVLPGDEAVAPSEVKSPAPSRAPLIGGLIALLGVGVALLLWRVARAPDAPVTSTATTVEAPAEPAPTHVALTPTAAPPLEVAPPAPTGTASADEATTKDGKKKKKKKPVTTAKPPATSAPTAAPTTPTPAFQFQFE
jgi:hypothetical protein